MTNKKVSVVDFIVRKEGKRASDAIDRNMMKVLKQQTNHVHIKTVRSNLVDLVIKLLHHWEDNKIGAKDFATTLIDVVELSMVDRIKSNLPVAYHNFVNQALQK